MGETPTITRPEWLEVGAQVICWTSGGASATPNYALGTVSKINKTTFRVTSSRHGEEPLFPIAEIDGRHTKRGVGAWAHSRHAAHRLSTVGCTVEARMRDQVALNRATTAVRNWERTPRDRKAIEAAHRELGRLLDQLDRGPREGAADTGTDTAREG